MKIIKLTGKIRGIAPIDSHSVNVCIITTTASTLNNSVWQTSPYKDEIVLPYQGPAHVSAKELKELALTSDTYGVGTNISNLFEDDEVEVYVMADIKIDASDNQHLIVNHVILINKSKKPKTLSEFLMEFNH